MRKKQPQIVLQRKGRAELERLLADGNTAQKIAKRARIVLMSADGRGHRNQNPKPFTWTAKAKPILASHRRTKKAMAIVKAGCK